MCVRSGAAVTSVSPNKNGEIEFYISTKIGDESKVCTDFRYEYKLPNGATASGSGGGSTGTYIHGLRIGDADSDSMLTISDATKIQFAIARLDTLNSLQKFTTDVNYLTHFNYQTNYNILFYYFNLLARIIYKLDNVSIIRQFKKYLITLPNEYNPR